jgi:hypothetical protein
MLGFHPYFDILHNLNGTVVSYKRRPQFNHKKILWYSFLSNGEWNPGLLNADRRAT